MPTAIELIRCMDAICHAADPLPELRLSPGERMRRAAYCTDDADTLVRAVVRALRLHPELFPDVGADPEALMGRLDRSVSFLALARLFERLRRCALDGYLIDRSAAVQGALDVIGQVRTTARHKLPYPGQERREAALRLAEHILTERKVRRQRKARRNAAAPPPAPAPPRRSPQRRAADEARRLAHHAPAPEALLPPPPTSGR